MLGRKPFTGSVKANVERFGTGALNIDACRIETTEIGNPRGVDTAHTGDHGIYGHYKGNGGSSGNGASSDLGRWPANVLLDEEAATMLDAQTGDVIHSAGHEREGSLNPRPALHAPTSYTLPHSTGEMYRFGDSGGASRFYYVAKPSREERDYGCEGLHVQSGAAKTGRSEGSIGLIGDEANRGQTANPYANGAASRNSHPTVKPIELMRWLVKLVTPIGGTVLDPFTGSGTTGMACRYEQRGFVGIEREAEYVAIAERRIAAVCPLFSTDDGTSEAVAALDPVGGVL